MYTPFDDKAITVVVPGPQGGTNWQPTSYSPETEMFYVCAQAAFSGLVLSDETVPPGKQGSVADIGGSFVTTGFGDHPGYFTAIDAHTGEIKWQKRWPESCYSGSTATAGGLVFVGRNSGHLEAYDAENGELMWSFQTGAGANSTATVFEHDGTRVHRLPRGRQRARGDAARRQPVALRPDGTMEAARGRRRGGGRRRPRRRDAGRADWGRRRRGGGQAVWADNCSGCHGPAGHGRQRRPRSDLDSAASNPQRVLAQVTNGGGGMPAFDGTLSQKEIKDVTAFVVEDITGGG